jgi:hypothetical protein
MIIQRMRVCALLLAVVVFFCSGLVARAAQADRSLATNFKAVSFQLVRQGYCQMRTGGKKGCHWDHRSRECVCP